MSKAFPNDQIKSKHQKYEKAKTPFSRNKILHGEYLDYDKTEYLIWCLMMIDFFAELKDLDDESCEFEQSK